MLQARILWKLVHPIGFTPNKQCETCQCTSNKKLVIHYNIHFFHVVPKLPHTRFLLPALLITPAKNELYANNSSNPQLWENLHVWLAVQDHGHCYTTSHGLSCTNHDGRNFKCALCFAVTWTAFLFFRTVINLLPPVHLPNWLQELLP